MLSQGLYKGINYFLVVVLFGLISEILARSLDKEEVKEYKVANKHCFCHIEDIESGDVVYNYGLLESYDLSGEFCHEAHSKCRKACTEKLHLKRYDGVGTTRRGYSFCNSLGRVTPGGAAVELQAVWKVDNCRSVHEVDSIKTADLCCGHTFIYDSRRRDNKKIFGWNPDCKSRQFVLGKIKQ